MIELPIITPDGEFLARYSSQGLCGLKFPSPAGQPSTPSGSVEMSETVCRWQEQTVNALTLALKGKPPHELPPLDLSKGTEFQQSVWQAMSRIACGRTSSYAQIAAAIGRPKAVRAVGRACGANPIPVLIPCHRVLAAHNELGGFSGGLEWKRLLLKREAVLLLE
ncbi:MAG TPA: methylated-DNA--[protein]-cysteine S-methyltransferase [Clostridia bacterium]|nr:methylated-DNA--[protein]-cysteine S-methyltransferase [Clostridia bacterium]